MLDLPLGFELFGLALFITPLLFVVGALVRARSIDKRRQRDAERRAELDAGRISDQRHLRSCGGHGADDGRRAA
jgi:hypothetical protein